VFICHHCCWKKRSANILPLLSGGAVGIVGVRDTTVVAGESFIVDAERIGAGEVFCTAGLRDKTTAREDVDIVSLSDTTAGKSVGKLRLQVAAAVGRSSWHSRRT
jgi:hypothetical protein